jgi:hypothetical protein
LEKDKKSGLYPLVMMKKDKKGCSEKRFENIDEFRKLNDKEDKKSVLQFKQSILLNSENLAQNESHLFVLAFFSILTVVVSAAISGYETGNYSLRNGAAAVLFVLMLVFVLTSIITGKSLEKSRTLINEMLVDLYPRRKQHEKKKPTKKKTVKKRKN